MRADFAGQTVTRSFDDAGVRGEDARSEVCDSGFTVAAQTLPIFRFVADQGHVPRTFDPLSLEQRSIGGKLFVDGERIVADLAAIVDVRPARGT